MVLYTHHCHSDARDSSGCTIDGEVCLLPKHIAFLVRWERLMRHSESALLAERKQASTVTLLLGAGHRKRVTFLSDRETNLDSARLEIGS